MLYGDHRPSTVTGEDENPLVAPAMVRDRFLFLSGVPRSGTTAFADLLNRHPKIAVGIERFKKLAMSAETADEFMPDLFGTERFFDFRATDTNVRSDNTYRRMRSRYDEAIWVGDKVPRYYARLPTIYDRFPGAVVFYIVRDLPAVARSWNARAQNPADSWPIENDYRRAAIEWNKGNRIALRWATQRPRDFHVVAYDDLFPHGIDLVGAIMARLGLDLELPFLKEYKIFMEAPRRPSGPRIEYDGQADYLAAEVDTTTYQKLLKLRLTA